MARIICYDPENHNNCIVLSEGAAGIYRDVDGKSQLFTPLQQSHINVLSANGEAAVLEGRYDNEPKVFLSPSNLQTYCKDAKWCNQKLVVGDAKLNALGNGKYSLAVENGISLSTIASNGAFYPVCINGEQYFLNSDRTAFVDQTAVLGPYHIPGLTYAKAVLSGYSELYGLTTVFGVGITASTSQPSSWGTATRVTANSTSVLNLSYFTLEAAQSGSGNYLWFLVQSSLAHVNDNDFFNFLYDATLDYSISGAYVNYSDQQIASSSDANAVVLEVG